MEASIALAPNDSLKKSYKESFFTCKSHFVSAIEDLKFNQEQNKLDMTENESSLNHFVNTENSNTLSALNAINAIHSKRKGKGKKKEEKEAFGAPLAIEIVRSKNEYDFSGNSRRQKIIKFALIGGLSFVSLIIIVVLIVVIVQKAKNK